MQTMRCRRDRSREVRKRHFIAEDLWIRLLIANKHPKHIRADRKASHNNCAWNPVSHAPHKSEQDAQPRYTRALYQALHHHDGLKVLLLTVHGSLKTHLQLTESTHRGKKFIAVDQKILWQTPIYIFINTVYREISTQRALCKRKVFPSPKAVCAAFSLEIMYIEVINVQKILTKTQIFRRFSIFIRKNITAFWKQIIKLLEWASMC